MSMCCLDRCEDAVDVTFHEGHYDVPIRLLKGLARDQWFGQGDCEGAPALRDADTWHRFELRTSETKCHAV